MGEKEAKGSGFLALAMRHDQRLAEEVRARLDATPAEEFVLVETEEDEKTLKERPVERRYVGRRLFRAMVPNEHNDGEWEMVGAALLEDGQLLMWSDYTEGTVMAETISPDASLREATRQPNTVLSSAWMLAMRLLGKPLWKAAT